MRQKLNFLVFFIVLLMLFPLNSQAITKQNNNMADSLYSMYILYLPNLFKQLNIPVYFISSLQDSASPIYSDTIKFYKIEELIDVYIKSIYQIDSERFLLRISHQISGKEKNSFQYYIHRDLSGNIFNLLKQDGFTMDTYKKTFSKEIEAVVFRKNSTKVYFSSSSKSHSYNLPKKALKLINKSYSIFIIEPVLKEN